MLNRIVALLTRLGLSVWGSRVLAVRGRSSGEWRTTPVNLLTAEPRIGAAVLGLCGLRGSSIVRSGIGGRLEADAPGVRCPLMFHFQWDDERFDRDSAIELYGLLGAEDKRLQSTPGLHGGVSAEARATLRDFLAGRLEAIGARRAEAAAAGG